MECRPGEVETQVAPGETYFSAMFEFQRGLFSNRMYFKRRPIADEVEYE